jgi:hypothetical protein
MIPQEVLDKIRKAVPRLAHSCDRAADPRVAKALALNALYASAGPISRALTPMEIYRLARVSAGRPWTLDGEDTHA